MVWQTGCSILGRVIPKTQKWYLMPPCLTLSITRLGSRVKYSNPGNWVAPSPTPRCSSYSKRNLLVTLDYSQKIYLKRCQTSIISFKNVYVHLLKIRLQNQCAVYLPKWCCIQDYISAYPNEFANDSNYKRQQIFKSCSKDSPEMNRVTWIKEDNLPKILLLDELVPGR